MRLVNANVDWIQMSVAINKDGIKTNADMNVKN